ncbi:hypothetical protein PUV54_06845 [Hyphococcus flavus]|uniref:Uncharacterized protein n=1 Tax=Hyphococcus flavus TaxID=1866326 RepID=A0AAE9ZDQ8_9PROT|nr:hypothetical protein [Hyphococcus flavus]WDI32914.1 hypothetical protein PUV54_06845 [Hyphococcus flavus]
MFGIKIGGAKPQAEAPKGEFVIARLNAKVQPIDRGEYYEDPLCETLEGAGLGDVTGGGTQMADEPYGIEFCDLEICVNEANEETLATIIKRLNDLGAPKGSKLIIEETAKEIPFGVNEGIGVFLNGSDLPDKVYAECDINHVVDEFDRQLGDKGAFRGYWEGSRETALYCYGRSFEEMKAALQPFLDSYPLCEGARIEQIA